MTHSNPNQRLRVILDEIHNLCPWAPVATKVMHLSRKPDVVPSELVSILQTDAAFTARVLKLCNSAFYGFQREVSSLQEAGNRLGVSALVNLVLTSCVGRAFCGEESHNSARSRRLWEHSVMNALAASWLADLHGGVDKNVAYTAGLLQNIGYIVLDSHLQDLRQEIRAQRLAGKSMLESERLVVGFDHAQIGARLLKRWDFPTVLVDTVLHHHNPKNSEAQPTLTSLVHIAESMTRAIAKGEGLGQLAFALSDRALGLSGLTQAQLEGMEENLMHELMRARDLVQAA
ncbi:MAG: putative nucleotidyltransferase with HDIG domain [Candidatus Paceibacteria bacterium]|jgi:putative nucleotidyltransferase with HDIG domain